jgi:hypothetical protein
MCVVPALQAHRDERNQDNSPHCGLFGSCGAAHARENGRADDALRFPTHSSEEAVLMANATSGEGVRAQSRCDDDTQTTPDFLRWVYRTEAYVPAARGRNALGILGLLNDYPTEDDLVRFMVEYRLEAADATFTVVPVNGGGNDESPPGVEAKPRRCVP